MTTGTVVGGGGGGGEGEGGGGGGEREGGPMFSLSGVCQTSTSSTRS